MQTIMRHPRATIEMAGFIPAWLSDENPKSPKQQLHDGYKFGGWDPFKGFTKLDDKDRLHYPGDPPQAPIIEWRFDNHPQRVLLYKYSWVAVVEPDGTFEVCRMD